jgi:hypothetical protein
MKHRYTSTVQLFEEQHYNALNCVPCRSSELNSISFLLQEIAQLEPGAVVATLLSALWSEC